MTRILVCSDIHANLTALEAVLKDAGKVDSVWCLGDVVGYGPDPNECIERLRTQPDLVCLIGNHDAAALGRLDIKSFNQEARQSIRWLGSTLTRESRDFLSALPETYIDKEMTLAHGSPRVPIWEYLLDVFSAANAFDYFLTSYCLVGHTHIPMVFLQDPDTGGVQWLMPTTGERIVLQKRMILNPGSVGQPRDHNPLASYAIYEPEFGLWELHRVEYDVESVQQRILKAGLPLRHAIRLADGW